MQKPPATPSSTAPPALPRRCGPDGARRVAAAPLADLESDPQEVLHRAQGSHGVHARSWWGQREQRQWLPLSLASPINNICIDEFCCVSRTVPFTQGNTIAPNQTISGIAYSCIHLFILRHRSRPSSRHQAVLMVRAQRQDIALYLRGTKGHLL